MRRLAALLVLLFVASPTAAQQQTLPVQVDLDHAIFAYDAQAALLEVYLAFGVTSLAFEADSVGFRTDLPLRLSVVHATDAQLPGTPTAPVWQDTTRLSFLVPDTTALLDGHYFIHQSRATLPPGEYELRASIPADGARQGLEMRRDVLVPDFENQPGTVISDLVLASSIQPSENRDDPFYKNGLAIQPNANQLYGSGLDRLFYYAEVYNADAAAGADARYTTYAYISEANRPQPVGSLQQRTGRAVRSPDVVVGSFDLATLPSGSYFLRIAVLNQDNEAVVEQTRKFFVYNPSVEREVVAAAEVPFEQSPYAVLSEEEVAKGLEHIDIIATERERRRARDIQDLDERRRFLMEFWQKRDPNMATAVNEYRDEFYQRLQYANDRYATSFSEGWKTDRGRAIIKYGPPAAIEPHLYERDTHPYEIWQYNNIPGEGQAVFIFADRSGFNQFELLHSSVAGERKSPDWEVELRR